MKPRRQHHRRRRAGEIGMTLIEMLVVLAIVGISAGAVTLGIGAATRAPNVETEARRLAGRLQVASDDAMLGDRLMALTVTDHGYGFATYVSGTWQPRTDDALAYHELPGGMVVQLSVKPPVILGSDGSGQPLSATVEAGTDRWQVVFDGLTAIAIPARPS